MGNPDFRIWIIFDCKIIACKNTKTKKLKGCSAFQLFLKYKLFQ